MRGFRVCFRLASPQGHFSPQSCTSLRILGKICSWNVQRSPEVTNKSVSIFPSSISPYPSFPSMKSSSLLAISSIAAWLKPIHKCQTCNIWGNTYILKFPSSCSKFHHLLSTMLESLFPFYKIWKGPKKWSYLLYWSAHKEGKLKYKTEPWSSVLISEKFIDCWSISEENNFGSYFLNAV